jgi:hypothetical protein
MGALALALALSDAAGCVPTAYNEPGSAPSNVQSPGTLRGGVPRLAWRAQNADPLIAAVDVTGGDPIALAVLGHPSITQDEWASFLSVRLVPPAQAQPQPQPENGERPVPPVQGAYSAEGGVIRFQPRYPLEPGALFRAEFDPVRLHAVALKYLRLCGDTSADWPLPSTNKLVADFSAPKPHRRAPARVVAVYPSGSHVPENLLRLYIHFSAPMSRGEAYERIHLVDASGKPVAAPFLELAEELWSNDGRRFTLLFDPGRIKRGLKPREEAGPVLEAGKEYTLAIDGDWLDALGNPLENGCRRTFVAGPPDLTCPDPKSWKVQPPRAGTREPLVVLFPEVLDQALSLRLVTVDNDAGESVSGQASTAAEETAWTFTPRDPWRPGRYRLSIGTDLEDLAGNSVARPFEVDLTGPITAQVKSETVKLPFAIGASAATK